MPFFENLLFELSVNEFFLRMIEDPEDISAQLGGAMSQSVIVRFALQSLKLVIVFDRSFASCHIVGRPDQSVAQELVASLGHPGCRGVPCGDRGRAGFKFK